MNYPIRKYCSARFHVLHFWKRSRCCLRGMPVVSLPIFIQNAALLCADYEPDSLRFQRSKLRLCTCTFFVYIIRASWLGSCSTRRQPITNVAKPSSEGSELVCTIANCDVCLFLASSFPTFFRVAHRISERVYLLWGKREKGFLLRILFMLWGSSTNPFTHIFFSLLSFFSVRGNRIHSKTKNLRKNFFSRFYALASRFTQVFCRGWLGQMKRGQEVGEAIARW